MNFSERIKQMRIEKGMTQEEFAQKVMVSRTAVSKWETGRGYPSLESLMVICDVFGVGLDEFFSKEDAALKEKNEKKKVRKATISVIMICLLIVFAINLFFSYMTAEKDIAKTLYFHLKNLNYQMEETSEMIDYAYNNGNVNSEMFESVCRNLFKHCWETSKAIDEIADFRKNKYKDYEVFYIGDWAAAICAKTQKRTKSLSDDEIKEIYNSIKLICDKWRELDWKGIGGYEEYDFKNDPGNMAEHIAAMTALADEEFHKLMN